MAIHNAPFTLGTKRHALLSVSSWVDRVGHIMNTLMLPVLGRGSVVLWLFPRIFLCCAPGVCCVVVSLSLPRAKDPSV